MRGRKAAPKRGAGARAPKPEPLLPHAAAGPGAAGQQPAVPAAAAAPAMAPKAVPAAPCPPQPALAAAPAYVAPAVAGDPGAAGDDGPDSHPPPAKVRKGVGACLCCCAVGWVRKDSQQASNTTTHRSPLQHPTTPPCKHSHTPRRFRWGAHPPTRPRRSWARAGLGKSGWAGAWCPLAEPRPRPTRTARARCRCVFVCAAGCVLLGSVPVSGCRGRESALDNSLPRLRVSHPSCLL